MKNALLVLICLASFQLSANMASPVMRGTLGSRPFVNQYVDVLHEDVYIKVDKEFRTAQFNVTYHIKSSKEGLSIPFLFYASEYLDDFTIKIDGVEINILPIPDELKVPNRTKFEDFSYFFEPPSYQDESTITLYESSTGGRVLTMRDMLYFEADIPIGEHDIEVSYTAIYWTDKSDWTKEYSFRYALSPAKYWKSFGTLKIQIDASDFDKPMTSNLGKPSNGNINNIATWEFDKLPIEIAQWSYQTPLSPLVKKLVYIGPNLLALITAIILAILHYIWVRNYRKRHAKSRFSFPVLIGSIIVTFAFTYCSMYYYDLIDDLIGSEAGHFHGYTFIFVLFSPLIFVVYLMIFWLIDRDFKRGPSKEN